jgi:ABC-type antimicrobial peptide transport system ATPase subunit
MSWVAAAWAWLKKWWKWLLPVVGAALWLLGKMGRKNVVVVSPELTQHETVAVDAEAKAQAAMTAAAVARDKKIAIVDQDYDAVIKKMDEADERKKVALADDPIALNKFLKEIGSRADRS